MYEVTRRFIVKHKMTQSRLIIIILKYSVIVPYLWYRVIDDSLTKDLKTLSYFKNKANLQPHNDWNKTKQSSG
jgi:hypothetical protein